MYQPMQHSTIRPAIPPAMMTHIQKLWNSLMQRHGKTEKQDTGRELCRRERSKIVPVGATRLRKQPASARFVT